MLGASEGSTVTQCQGGQEKRLWTGRWPHKDGCSCWGRDLMSMMSVTSIIWERHWTLASPPNKTTIYQGTESCWSAPSSITDKPPEESSLLRPSHPGDQLADTGLSKLQDCRTMVLLKGNVSVHPWWPPEQTEYTRPLDPDGHQLALLRSRMLEFRAGSGCGTPASMMAVKRRQTVVASWRNQSGQTTWVSQSLHSHRLPLCAGYHTPTDHLCVPVTASQAS